MFIYRCIYLDISIHLAIYQMYGRFTPDVTDV